jgi:pSer/pThr/pTyr-binding forkhead associated (FHA) protein
MRFVFDLRASDEPSMRWAKTAQSITIGRHPECDLVLVSELVSGKHAVIEESGSAAVVRDLGSTNGTYLNGNRVSAPSPLRVGDSIAFGQGGTTLTAFALEPSARVPSTLQLRPDPAFVPARTVRVGRAPDNELVLDDPSVSAHHARVLVDRKGQGVVEDLDSTNGIAVGNPANKTRRAEFGRGDSIYFGAIPVAGATFLPGPPPPPKAGQGGPPDRSLLLKVGIPVAACLLFVGLAALGAVAFRQRKTQTVAVDDQAPSKPDPQTRPDSSPVTPVEKPTPPKQEPKEDLDSLVRRAQSAVVWLAVRHKDYLFPIASAWAVKPNLVVTTADVVTELQIAAAKPDMKVVAWSNGQEIAAESLRSHPKYSEADSGGEARGRFNIGTVRLSTALAGTLEAATQETVRSLDSATPLRVTGFFTTTKESLEPYDRLKLRFEHAPVTLRSTEFDRPGLAPVFLVDVSASPGTSAGRWLDGAPVLTPNGAVVGLLAVGTGKTRLVPMTPFLWDQDF